MLLVQMKRRRLQFIMFFMLSCVMSFADNKDVKIVRYDADDGLLNANVLCAFQDHIGYIWMATYDGLVRFDGTSFRTYKAWVGDDCPLTVNYIDFIGEDKNHDILCFSDSRYFKFRRSTGKFEVTADSLTERNHFRDTGSRYAKKLKHLDEYKNISIKVRLVDNQGGLWVWSTRGLERVTYVRKKVKRIKENDGAEEFVRALMCDNKKRIWVADKNGYVRIYGLDMGKPLYLDRSGRLSAVRTAFGHNVYSIFEDSRGRIWLGAKPGGLFLLKPVSGGYSISHSLHDEGNPYSLSCNFVYSVMEDSRHRVWIATFGGGLNRAVEAADGSLKFINRNNNLKHFPDKALFIHGMDITKDNVILLCTRHGLYTCDAGKEPGKMNFYCSRRRQKDSYSIGANNVLDVHCGADGSVFVATSGGGISKVISRNLLADNLRFVSFTSRSGLLSDVYLTLVTDRTGRLWGVGNTGLSEMNASGNDIVNYSKGLFDERLLFSEARPLCLDDGRLLFGTTRGFVCFNPDEIKKSSYVPKIVFDTPGHIELQPGNSYVKVEFSALDFERNEPIVYRYRLDGVDEDWHYTKNNHIDYTNFPIGTYRLRVTSTNSDGVWVDNEKSITICRRAAFHETWYSWMLYGVLLVLFVMGIYKTIRYISRLKREMNEQKKEMDVRLDYLANRVEDLIKGNADVVPEPEKVDDGVSRFVERARSFVLDNISEPDISVDDFARYMNMSSSLLYIKCKKNLGYTPNNYIRNVRISYAIKLLTNSPDISIADVAYKCGFSDPKYFGRCFKKITGQNPTDYRNR